MRLDKYLKTARILKRRTIAKELADNDRIQINGHLAKPSSEVNVNDEITITFGNRKLSIRVLSVEETQKKSEALEMYEILSQTIEEEDKQ